MTAVTLRPTSVQKGNFTGTLPANWVQAGGGTNTAAGWGTTVSDNSDTTYLTDTGAGSDQLSVKFGGAAGLPSSTTQPVWTSLTVRIRASQASGSESLLIGTQLFNNGTGNPLGGSGLNILLVPTSTIQTFTLPADTTWSGYDAVAYTPIVQVDNGGSQDHRIYEVYLDTTYNNNSVATVTVTNTNSIQPTYSWTVADDDGDASVDLVLRVFSAAQWGVGGFNPDTSTYTFQRNPTSSPYTPGASLAVANNYRAYIGVRDGYHSGYRWAFAQFNVTYPLVGVPLITSSTVDPGTASVALSIRGMTNVVTYQQNSLEDGTTTGWSADVNCTLAIVNTGFTAQLGVNLLKLTATATAATMSAKTSGTFAPVLAGQRYYVLCSQSGGTAAKNVRIGVDWYTGNGTGLISRTFGSYFSTSSASPLADLTAPAGANYAAVVVEMQSPTAADTLNIDAVGILPYDPATLVSVVQMGGALATQKFLVERSVDSGTTWTTVTSLSAVVPANDVTQLATVRDYTAPIGIPMLYRVSAYAPYPYTGSNSSSPPSPNSASLTLTNTKFWLRDPTNLTDAGLVLSIRGSLKHVKRESQAVFQPLGRTRPVVLADKILGEQFEVPLNFYDEATYDRFDALRALQRTLLLVSDMGDQWYVRIGPERATELPVSTTRRIKPYRAVDVTMLEVDAV